MAHQRNSIAIVEHGAAHDFTTGESDWLLQLLRVNDLEQFYQPIRDNLQISKYVSIFIKFLIVYFQILKVSDF